MIIYELWHKLYMILCMFMVTEKETSSTSFLFIKLCEDVSFIEQLTYEYTDITYFIFCEYQRLCWIIKCAICIAYFIKLNVKSHKISLPRFKIDFSFKLKHNYALFKSEIFTCRQIKLSKKLLVLNKRNPFLFLNY